MPKSILVVACLVCTAALLGAGVVSTQAGTLVPVQASPLISATTPMLNSGLTVADFLLPTPWSHKLKSGDGNSNGKYKDNHKVRRADGEAEDDEAGEDEAPAPTPEPTTLLSFGVALIIGGGVFFLGRLRKEGK